MSRRSSLRPAEISIHGRTNLSLFISLREYCDWKSRNTDPPIIELGMLVWRVS